MDEKILFNVQTHIGYQFRVSKRYWEIIVTIKHPVMKSREKIVQRTLANPIQIRRSRKDANVFLFYRKDKPDHWICAVAKKLDEDDGFLITTYPTDAIK